MKIGFVVTKFPTLSETFVVKQVDAMRQLGHDVSVICDVVGAEDGIAFDTEPLRSLMPRVHSRWPTPNALRGRIDRLREPFRDKAFTAADLLWNRNVNDCDVLIAHFGGNGSRLARTKKRGRLAPPIVTIFHGYDVGVHDQQRNVGSAYRALFEYGSLHLTVNDVFRRILVEAGAPAERARVHHMGIDCDEIAYHWRAMNDGPLELVSVCRLVEKKGIEFALRALADLSCERPDIAWRYTVIGDGPLREGLRRLADGLGLGERVRFLGPRPHAEVKSRLARSNVFILPSVRSGDGDVEGIPVALMEAMASGLIVVSSRHSGIPELVEDRARGFLSDERDVASLAADVAWIADNHAACEPVTKAARRHVEQAFNNRILHAELSNLVTALADDRRAA